MKYLIHTMLFYTLFNGSAVAENAPWDLLLTKSDETVTTGSLATPKTITKPQSELLKANIFNFGGESSRISTQQIKELLNAAEKGNVAAVDEAKRSFGDNSAAATLAEWVYLRRAIPRDAQQMAANFVRQNPDWPEIKQIQRMAQGNSSEKITSEEPALDDTKIPISQMIKAGKLREAASALQGGDFYWSDRNQVIRASLDAREYHLAYDLAKHHQTQKNTNQMEGEFLAGWISLRFLNDAARAERHFTQLERIAERPISKARAYYWRGRAVEAMGNASQAEWHYKNAAQFPTTYYGMLAKANIGVKQLSLPHTPVAGGDDKHSIEKSRLYQSIQLLLKADKVELSNIFVKDFANKLDSVGHLTALGHLVNDHGTPKHSVLVGKAAAAKGVILTKIAYPVNGIPPHDIAGPGVEKAVVYAIARQESEFDPAVRSRANAQGLMQMIPSTAAATARKFGIRWQPNQLYDPRYNATLGATHLGELISNYNGSYIMTFAAYNAGPGRVREWVQKYGDPRDGKTDPIDWVERIPFSETRNYVMRVLENTLIYRARLQGNSTALLIEQDLMRGSGPNPPQQKGWFE